MNTFLDFFKKYWNCAWKIQGVCNIRLICLYKIRGGFLQPLHQRCHLLQLSLWLRRNPDSRLFVSKLLLPLENIGCFLRLQLFHLCNILYSVLCAHLWFFYLKKWRSGKNFWIMAIWNQKINIVEEFTYLEILFNCNGNFSETPKHIALQGEKVLFCYELECISTDTGS